MRKDIPVSILRSALLNYLNWTPRWYRLSGPLPLDQLAGSTTAYSSTGLLLRARPSFPHCNRQNCRGPEHPRKTPARSASSFGRRLNCFRNTVTRTPAPRSISKLIGMEKATLYYHVNSKEDLLYLIAKSSVETLQADVHHALARISCPFGQLAHVIQAHCMSLLG